MHGILASSGSLRVYNTLTGRKERFEPLSNEKVGIYVCGITAYDYSHIGHARAAVVFDAIVRYLRHSGLMVTYVQNITDIDDKIINRARETGTTTQELSKRFTGEYHADMESLGVLPPDVEPEATEHIPDIIDLIERLSKKGHAYEAEGSVYFAVETFPSYGKLSRRSVEEMQAGARVEIDRRKRNPMDFALWKASKASEPAWESPWGRGRPGWHIECSAMSMRYLGETFDIHGGGKDLTFPHHENEIAQSEAATGKPFVRYFVHNGFVTINGEKMSKSLGNFLTIKEILARHDPQALRLFLLSKHYRSPLDYSEEFLNEAETSLDRVYTTLNAVLRLGQGAGISEARVAGGSADPEMEAGLKKISGLQGLFHEAMDDDFNTALALAHIFEAVRATNMLIDHHKKTQDEALLPALHLGAESITNSGRILGLFTSAPDAFLSARKKSRLAGIPLTEEEILTLVQQRNEARRIKDWAAADAIRKKLAEANIVLKDSPQGTTWEVK
ncbi:MAG: cysteine--tRNA ligase [Pseudomonadota bacterium]